MSGIQNLISELREKRLWPVALALVIALIAVPVLLSSSPAPTTPAALPAVGGPSASVPALPAVSVTKTPSTGRLAGHARNPFAQQKKPAATGGTGSGSKKSTPSGGSSSTASKGSTASGGTTTGSTTGSTTTVTTTTTPATTTPKPIPAGLTATQSYHVAFAITNSAGGIDTVDPVERLSILPSAKLPLLVELGVLKGGARVLFAVQPGTTVAGPGTCIPGPIDCEVLSLAADQNEGLWMSSPTGSVPVAQFAITSIRTDEHSSAAAADQARQAASAAGRRLLSTSKLSALSLFPYDESLGALLDLRNVTGGGN